MAKKFKNILLIGSTGLLGSAILQELKDKNYKVLTPDSEEFDITDQELALEYLRHAWPDLVINCASVSDVDENEEQLEIWPELVNHYGSVVLANICRDMGLKLVSFSCSHVFDGSADTPYTEEHQTNPVNNFGMYNMESEEVILSSCPGSLIIRTSWLFGPERTNLVSLVARKVQVGEAVELAKGLVSNPSYSFDVAAASIEAIEMGATGILHIVNSGMASMTQFAKASLDKLGMQAPLSEVPADVIFAARRPVYSCLCTKRLENEFGIVLRSWEEALTEYVDKYKSKDILLSDDIMEAEEI